VKNESYFSTEIKQSMLFNHIYINVLSNKLRNSILFLSLLIIGLLDAQELHFNQLTVNDGLTQHDVSCIEQDSFGFIWIGTYDGLNRYDGFQVKTFSSKLNDENSLPSNRIKCLFTDSKNRLWIGTDGYGLSYYSLIKEKIFRVATPEGFEIINAISENTEGTILAATSNGLLKIIEDSNPSTELLQTPLTGLIVNKLVVDYNGVFYASSNNGLWKINNTEATQIKKAGSIYHDALAIDLENNIWVSGGKVLKKISIHNGKVTILKKEFGNFNIRSLSVSKNGDIWAGTENNGLVLINASSMDIIKQKTFQRDNVRGLLSNTVLNLFCDQSNTMWIANRKGVCFADLEQKKFFNLDFDSYNGKLTNKHIRTLYKKDNYLYFGIQNDGYYKYSFVSKKIEKLKFKKNLNPFKISELNGVLHFISGRNGVYLLKNDGITLKEKQLFKTNTNRPIITSMCSDRFGNEYYGSFRGLVVKNKIHTEYAFSLNKKLDVLRGKRILEIVYDNTLNCIWVGTISSGIFKLNLDTEGQFQSLEMYNNSMSGSYYIPNNSIWSFLKDEENNFFIGTDAGLLQKKATSSRFEIIEANGIIDKKIMGIAKDKTGKIWLNNSQGLICFDPSKNTVLNYTYHDGLESSTLTETIQFTSDNTVFVGTNSGINYFRPDEIKSNLYPAYISFTDFKIHNENILPNLEYFGSTVLTNSINATEKIILNHKQNNFLLEFTGTNYANSQSNTFKYRLKGYQDDWTAANSKYRFAKYSNLPSGNYTFEIEAANHDGLWSKTGKSIQIIVKPAPWFTPWAYLSYSIIIIVLIGSFIYFLNNRQKLNHQIELDKILLKQEHEINEVKLRFFTDVAHEFKTPLSLIIGPLKELMNGKLSKERVDFSYQVVARNTQRMMHLVHQFLDFRKINLNINILKVNNSNLSQFIVDTSQAFLWQAANDHIEFKINCPENFNGYFDRAILEKVIYNLLSNAFKYTPKNGKIELELKKIGENDKVSAHISIKDSGHGISDKNKKEIFKRYFHGKDHSSSGIGLHLSNSLVEAHKGSIIVSDSIYGGTEFTIIVPVDEKTYSGNYFFKGDSNTSTGLDNFKFKKSVSDEKTLKKECVLIVEDDHDLRQYLTNFLQDKFIIAQANNGKEGLLKAQELIPDLIISDVMMPELDGVSMCRKLKKNVQTSHIPVLMLTAKTDEDSKNIGLEVGAWDYISKPFNTNDLGKKIENIIRTRNNFKSFILNQNITPEVKKHYTLFDQKLISKIKKIIEDNMSNSEFTTDLLSKEIGLSRMQLHRKLKSLSGQSTTNFINNIKMTHAANLFKNGMDRVQEVMDLVGMNSYSHFNSKFKNQYGKTPSEFIKDIKSS